MSPDCSKYARAVEASRRAGTVREPELRRRHLELDPRHHLGVALDVQKSFGCGQSARGIPRHDQPFELCRAGGGTRLRCARPAEEKVEGAPRPLRDGLEGLHRRLRFPRLYEVNSPAADLVPCPLGQAQAGITPRLFDCAGLDLDTAAAAPTARGCLPCPPRAVFG